MTKARGSSGLRYQLERLTLRAEQIQHLLDREYSFRSETDPRQTPVLALDFDVIFSHVYPHKVGDWRLVEAADALFVAITRSSDCRFTLPPGALSEFMHHTTGLLKEYSRSVAAALGDQGEDLLLERRRNELARFVTGAELVSGAVQRSTAILRAPNYVPFGEVFPDLALGSIDRELIEQCSAALIAQRGRIGVSSFVDAVNLAVALTARQYNKPLSLVTNTRAIMSALASLPTERDAVERSPAVIDPYAAILRLGLTRATPADIGELSSALASLREVVEAYDVSWQEPPSDPYEFSRMFLGAEHHLTELTFKLVGMDQAVSHAWRRPSPDIPENIDLDQLAALARQAAEQARAAFAALLVTTQHVLLDGARFFKTVARELPEASEGEKLLSIAAYNGDVHVRIDQLLQAAPRSNIHSSVVTNRAARDLVAEISALTPHMTKLASGGQFEVAKHIRELIDAVVESDVALAKKRAVIDELSRFTKGATIASPNKTKIAKTWQVIKEIVQTVPVAVTAWDALVKLFN